VVVVKGPTHRQRQAQATKEQVARAARALFAERGYVATTIAAIAEAAEIPAQTIYSAFGGKANILSEVARLAAEPIHVDRRHAAALAHPDPAAGLRAAAAIQRHQFEVMSDVVAVFTEASRGDAEIAAALAGIMAHREQAFSAHLTGIADRLRPGLTAADALDIYVALVVPEVYHTLVRDRGWSPERYETWLGDTLVAQLLPPG
jgi:AcrR family transcriptional regulator